MVCSRTAVSVGKRVVFGIGCPDSPDSRRLAVVLGYNGIGVLDDCCSVFPSEGACLLAAILEHNSGESRLKSLWAYTKVSSGASRLRYLLKPHLFSFRVKDANFVPPKCSGRIVRSKPSRLQANASPSGSQLRQSA